MIDGFMMMDKDYCMHVKHSKSGFVILSLYGDDILLAGNGTELGNGYLSIRDERRGWD